MMGTGLDGTTVPVGRDKPITTRKSWGNSRWIAGELYVEIMLHYLRMDHQPYFPVVRNVFELGSGYTTVLLSHHVERRPDVTVTSLEHMEGWWAKAASEAPNVNVVLTPLILYRETPEGDQFRWYEMPTGIFLPDLESIELLLVDGPPRIEEPDKRSARYGALPVLAPYLKPHCRIIVDDLTPEHELALEWQHEFGCTVIAQYTSATEDVLVLEYPGPTQVAS
jgi:hypothetical protein